MRFGQRFAFLLSLSSLAIVMAACGGSSNDDSSGTSKDSLENIDPGKVNVATAACPSGYEHPNICCTGGDTNQPAACAAYVNSPFHACDSGWTTYPNAASCCSLANPSDCTTCDSNGTCSGPTTPPTGGGGGGSGGDPGCRPPPSNPCPPGWHGESEDCATGGCWQYQRDPKGGPPVKVGYCNAHSDGGSSGGGTDPTGPIGGGSSEQRPDAGTSDGGGCGEPQPPTGQCAPDACGAMPPIDPRACGCRDHEPCAGSATCSRDARTGQCTWKVSCGGTGPQPPTCRPPCPPGWDPSGPNACCHTDPLTNQGVCFAHANSAPRH